MLDRGSECGVVRTFLLLLNAYCTRRGLLGIRCSTLAHSTTFIARTSTDATSAHHRFTSAIIASKVQSGRVAAPRALTLSLYHPRRGYAW